MIARHVFRSLIKSKSQAAALFIIVFCAVFISAFLSTTITQTQKAVSKLVKSSQQDFQFVPALSVKNVQTNGGTDRALMSASDALGAKYGFTYEKRQYKNVLDGDNKYLIYSSNRTIDVPIYDSGRNPKETEEIAVDLNFARSNGYKVGGYLTVQGSKYRITGLFSLPDQITPQIDASGAGYRGDRQAILLLSAKSFEKLSGNNSTLFVARFDQGISSMKEKMLSDTAFQSIVFTEDNARILSNITAKINLNKVFSYVSLFMLLGMSAIILIMAVIKKVSESQASMGVLKAMGYSNLSISSGYALYGILIFIAALAGFVTAFFIEPSFMAAINSSFLLPSQAHTVDFRALAIFTVVPAMSFAFVAVLTAAVILRHPPLMLIHENNKSDANILVRWIGTRRGQRSFLKTVSTKSCINNPALMILVFLAGLSLCCMTLMSLMTFQMTTSTVNIAMKGADYSCNVRYKGTKTVHPSVDVTPYEALPTRLRLLSGAQLNNAQVIVIDNSRDLFKLYDKNTDNILDIGSQNGIIINQWMMQKYGLKIGDAVQILNGDHEYNVKVAGIDQLISGYDVYMNFSYAQKLGILKSVITNGEFSRASVKYNPDKHIFVSTVQDVRATIISEQSRHTVMSILILICGVLIGSVILVLALKIVMQESSQTISMMKAYGYTNKECNHAILSAYRKIAYAGFAVGIPYTIMLCFFMFDKMAESSDMVYPMQTNIPDIFICLVLFGVLYEVILALYKKSMDRITLREIMTA